MFNDDWMRDRGFLDKKTLVTAQDLIEHHKNLKLLTIKTDNSIQEAYAVMKKYDVSQLPVCNEHGQFVGSLSDSYLFEQLFEKPDLMTSKVEALLQGPFPMVKHNDSIESIAAKITKQNQAVLMSDLGGNIHIITKFDLISSINQ
jgi:cystathionine beta-synthase